MKKIALIFSVFLITGPVLAEGIENDLMSSPKPLELTAPNLLALDAPAHQEAVKATAPEGGLISKTVGAALGFGKKILVTPGKLVSKVISWKDKQAEQSPRAEAAKAEDRTFETSSDLSGANVPAPRLALKVNADDRMKSLLAAAHEENISSPVPSMKGAPNERLKVQFLLQDIISTEGK